MRTLWNNYTMVDIDKFYKSIKLRIPVAEQFRIRLKWLIIYIAFNLARGFSISFCSPKDWKFVSEGIKCNLDLPTIFFCRKKETKPSSFLPTWEIELHIGVRVCNMFSQGRKLWSSFIENGCTMFSFLVE